MIVRRRIDLEGIVQGVGFRPYVFRLATESELAGIISNTSSGVTVEVEGSAEAVEEFVARLPQEPPPLARIIQFEVTDIACRGDSDFRILPSRRGEHVQTLISADVARAPIAWENCSTRRTGATGIHSSTAPIAARASPSFATFLMTGHTPRWRRSACAPSASGNMTIP